MSEDDFYKLQGDSYRGSKYANFTGGGITPQGNVSSVATEDSANKTGTNASPTSDAPPTPTNASKGLTSEMGKPSLGGALVSSALPAAGQAIGQAAGAAIGSGATFGEGISQGVSSLANKVSGGLIGEASTPASIIGASGAGQSTKAAYDVASHASDAGSFGSGANIGAGAGAGIASAAAVLLSGGGIKKAATTGVGAGVGTMAGQAIGTAILPGIGTAVGGFIGGAVGGAIGGRVICTQLVKDGLLSKEDQRLDMDFTFHALSHIHVRGYLFWARGWVEKMKKSPRIRDITLKIVIWRLNEIKYQLGMRDNPDWKGKAVRLVMENFCFIVGLFVADTAESVIYKKESNHVSA